MNLAYTVLKELEWDQHHYDPAHNHTYACPVCGGAKPGTDIRFLGQHKGGGTTRAANLLLP